MTYLPTTSSLEPYARLVASAYGVPVSDLTGPTRTARIAAARHVAMWLASIVGKRTREDVGQFFQRDHSSVCHALKRVRAARDTDKRFRTLLERLEADAGDLCRHGEARHCCDSCDAPYAEAGRDETDD